MKTKSRGFAWLILLLFLTGCAARGQAVVPVCSATEPLRTASPLTVLSPSAAAETPASLSGDTPSPVVPSASPAEADVPSFSPEPDESPEPAPTAPLPAPQATGGVAVRHEGSGENASKIIVLDPGHQRVGMSEKEPNSPATDVMKAKVTYGTQGVATGIPEYELNLAVALYARDALLAKGYTVIMTHEVADVQISNIERTEIANNAHAAALVHIHANGSDERDVRGAMTICQTKENPACGEVYEDSFRLAETLLQTYCDKTGIRKEYVWKTDTMTGINWSRVPVATLEMGYMSNPDEDRLMARDSFRRTAGDAIAQAIDAFLNP